MKKLALLIIFTFSCSLILISCMLNVRQTPTNLTDIFRSYSPLSRKDFLKEKAYLENLAEKGNPVDEEIYLRLAAIYVHSNNPNPNYSRALKSIESFIKMNPEAGEMGEIKSFVAILREIVKLEKENKDLNEKIKKLEILDIKIEEIREQSK